MDREASVVSGRPHASGSRVLLAWSLAVGLAWPTGVAGQDAACPPARPPPICLLVTLRAPSSARAAELRARLRADGITSAGPARELTIYVRPSQLRRVFGVRVRYALTPASASNRVICQAVLHSVRVPERYRDLVATIRFDPQLC